MENSCKGVNCLECCRQWYTEIGNGAPEEWCAWTWPKKPPHQCVVEFPLEEWAPWWASSGGPLKSSGHGWHLSGPGPHFSFVLKQHCWAFASRLLTLCEPVILSTYLLSLTQPPNFQGYLSNHTRSSLACSLTVWGSDPRIGSRMLTRGDIRGWKRGHRLNRKRCVG